MSSEEKGEPAASEWRRGALRGLVLPGYEDFDPESLPWEAVAARTSMPVGVQLAKRSRSRLVVSIEHRGERLYAKRFRPRTWKHRLSGIMQGDKLRREWFAAREFLALGVRVPLPVLYASGPGHVAYLVTRGLPPGWVCLAPCLRTHGLDDDLLRSLAEYTRWLHALPAYHDDYRTDHIYRTDAKSSAPVGERFALIDLDGARAGRAPSRKQREEALLELFVSLLRRPFTSEMAAEFLARYEPSMPREAGERLFEEAKVMFEKAKPERL